MVTKQVGIRIRVEKQLREEFQSACLAENRRASEVLREFMRVYLKAATAGMRRLPDHSGSFEVHRNASPFRRRTKPLISAARHWAPSGPVH